MKLLFDQNLSPRLPRLISDLYPGSVHVRDLGLREATDVVIWRHAQHFGFIIVAKDSDFQQRSLLFGHPPKFIWLRVGNCPARLIEELLRKHLWRFTFRAEFLGVAFDAAGNFPGGRWEDARRFNTPTNSCSRS